MAASFKYDCHSPRRCVDVHIFRQSQAWVVSAVGSTPTQYDFEASGCSVCEDGFRIAASLWKIFLLAYISPSLSISLQLHLSGPSLAQGTRHSDSGNRSHHSRARCKPQHWANLPSIHTGKSRLAILVSDSGCLRCHAVLRKA